MIAATTSGQTTTYTFNALNQLTGVSGPTGTFSYSYDALGYQISSTANGQTTNNLIDPFGLGNVAAQFDSSGNLIAHFTYGLGWSARSAASGTWYYYDYNLQGSTVGITNSAGEYVNQYSYDPFGAGHDGQRGDCESVYVCGAGWGFERWERADLHAGSVLRPETGQFVSNDQLGLAGGESNVRLMWRIIPSSRLIQVD